METDGLIEVSEKELAIGIAFAVKSLDAFEREILKSLSDERQGFTFTSFAQSIAKDRNKPLSTIKYHLRKLRENGLVRCGSANDRGRRIELSWFGRMIAKDCTMAE